MSISVIEQTAHPGNYGGSRSAAQIRYLVIHYTGNDGDRAASNAAYFQNTVVEASAHYFVDDSTVYRSVPDLRIAWAVGGAKWADCSQTGGGTLYGVVTNTNSLSVELCDTLRDGTYQATEATLANAAALCRELMAKYGIPLDRVVRHFDVNGKHCPSYLMDPAAWAAFKVRLESGNSGAGAGLPETKGEEANSMSTMDNTPSPSHKEGVEWAVKQGILLGNGQGDLMLSQPLTREQMCTMLHRYDSLGR